MNQVEKMLSGNSSDVVLRNRSGKEGAFEQIMVAPHEGRYYAILSPKSADTGLEVGAGYVFELREETGEILMIADSAVIEAVWAIYERLCEEEAQKA